MGLVGGKQLSRRESLAHDVDTVKIGHSLMQEHAF